MPELIDKKRTEAKVFLIARFFIDRPDREVELVKAVIHRCCEEIDKQPTIEPEVRHGRWIRRETALDTECKCSECGYKDFVPKHDNYWFRRKFCPNCGARMDAEDINVLAKDGGADNG